MTILQAHTKTFDWEGASGFRYHYEIHPIGDAFRSVPGNYIYSKQTKLGSWTPIYIGETDDLSKRVVDLRQCVCCANHGATHVHIRATSAGRSARLAEGADLRRKWKPPCNDEKALL